jgi:hypothetical protein
MAKRKFSNRDIKLWFAYLEIRNERVPLVDRWRDGSVTWHPRVCQKLIWYTGLKETKRNRLLVYDWLMRNAAKPARRTESSK